MMRARNSAAGWALGGSVVALLLTAFVGCDDGETEPGPTPTGSVTGTGTASTGGGGTGGTGGTGGSGATGGGPECTPDTTQDCYQGTANTEDVGICHGGTATCTAQETWGACEGQQLPETEDCDVAGDEDCDGVSCSEHVFSDMYGNAPQAVSYDVATDSAGNIAITGFYRGASFNLGGSDLPASGVLETNIFVALYDAAGVHQWSRGIGDANDDSGRAVAFDSNGDVIVTGMCEDATIDFGGGANGTCWQNDTFIAKFAGATGDAVWVRTMGSVVSTGLRRPQDIALDGSDNIIVVGEHNGVSPCVDPQGPGSFGAFVRKYSPDGNTITWTNCYDGPSSDTVRTVAVDSNSNIVIGGYFYGEVVLDQTHTSPNGNRIAYLAQLNAGGVPQWSWSFGNGTDSYNQIISELAIDGSNAILIGGYFANELVLSGSTSITGTGSSVDSYAAKYSAAGVYDWHVSWDDTTGDAHQRANALAVDSQGDVVVGGTFDGTVDFGGGDATADGADMFLVKLAGSNGVYLWDKQFGSTGGNESQEVIHALAIGADDQVIATGGAYGAIDFGSGSPLTHHGETDVFIAAFQP